MSAPAASLLPAACYLLPAATDCVASNLLCSCAYRSTQPTLLLLLPTAGSPLPPRQLPRAAAAAAGVYGRVAHLADIRDKKCVLAVTAAMGKDFDGVVVRDGEPSGVAGGGQVAGVVEW